MKENIKRIKIVPIIIIVGVIILPLLYSYFYLGAFWDPYSRLETVPVAIVNEDKGAIINNEERNVGEEMCKKLKEDGKLKFIFTDSETAKKGTEGKQYYATITIPSNFSENIASVSTTDKQIATITYTPNEKRNYLASQILNNAVVQIEKSVRSSINKEIVTELSDKLKSSPDQLTTLTDGLDKLFNGSSDLKNGTSDLKTGALELQKGASKLADGTTQLKDGSSNLQTGTNALSAGTDKLVNGSSDLKNGMHTFTDKLGEYTSGVETATKGSKELSDNMKTLDSGINNLLSGATSLETATTNLDDLKTGASSLAQGATNFNAGLVTYTTGVDSLISSVTQTTQVLAAYAQKTGDPTISSLVTKLASKENVTSLTQLSSASASLKSASSQISDGANRLATGTENISDLKSAISQIKAGLQQAKAGSAALSNGATNLNIGMVKLNTASAKLNNASDQLGDGTDTLNSGLLSLQKGITKVDTGTATLSDGITKVNNGANELKAGTNTLVNGSSDLDDGAKQLKDGIQEAKNGVNDSITNVNDQLKVLDGLDKYAENPVEVKNDAYAPVPNYGTSFAPYFMSLSLWVGGIMIFFGIYFDPDEKFKLLSRNSDKKIVRSFIFLGIGFLQSVILDFVLIVCLGLKVNNIGMFFTSSILVSLVFISLIQLLIVFLKNLGKFLSLVFLILQLTSCGGTFPMETVPKLFNVLYPFMPMTYSVGLFKEAISGVEGSSLAWKNAVVLFTILVVTMVITVLLSKAKKIRVGSLVEA